MTKNFKKRNLFFAALIIASVSLLYIMLAIVNIREARMERQRLERRI